MKPLLALTLLLGALLTPAVAIAHHNPHLVPVVTIEDSSYSLSLDYVAGAFDAYDGRGRWHMMSLTATLAPLPWMSVTATTGLARGIFDAGLLPEVFGVRAPFGATDSTVEVGLRLWRDAKRRMAFSIGLGAELPTGDADTRLGGGHVGLAGRLVFTGRIGHHLTLVTQVSVTGALPVGNQTHEHDNGSSPHLHGSLMAPHGEIQLTGRVGLTYTGARGWVGADLAATHAFKGPAAFGPLTFRVAAGITIDPRRLELNGSVTVPVAGLLPNLWVTQVGLTARFGRSAKRDAPHGGPRGPKKPHVGCGCGGGS